LNKARLDMTFWTVRSASLPPSCPLKVSHFKVGCFLYFEIAKKLKPMGTSMCSRFQTAW
jgi:hypothetical protein